MPIAIKMAGKEIASYDTTTDKVAIKLSDDVSINDSAGNVVLGNSGLTSNVVFPALGNSAVGTVSESSGTPTGDIIERGSNANGEFVKYADRTLICWEAGKVLLYGSGSTFRLSTKTFPISFVSVKPCVFMSGDPTDSSGSFDRSNDQRVYDIGLSSFNYLTASGVFSSDRTQGFSWVAIGRWY
jgi:hypothetical protein